MINVTGGSNNAHNSLLLAPVGRAGRVARNHTGSASLPGLAGIKLSIALATLPCFFHVAHLVIAFAYGAFEPL